MNGIIAWFAENRVAANMIMLLIIAGGLFAVPKIQKEIFPDVSLSHITIFAGYPGASPGEVEQAICVRLERAIADVRGIDATDTTANTNFCQIILTVAPSFKPKEVLSNVKSKVDLIGGFPRSIQGPTVQLKMWPNKVGQIMISGPASLGALRHVAETIQNDLVDLGLTRVHMGRERKYQITIEISEATLQKYNLSFAEIAAVIRRNSTSISSGAVNTSGGAVSVETVASTKTAEDFSEITLHALPDGSQVRLGDVATITDGFKEGNRSTTFNLKPAIQLDIDQQPGRSILDISEIINNYVDNPPRSFPEGISVVMDGDTALYFETRIGILLDNCISGLILLFVTLLLFLNFRLSFWVSTGIAVSFTGAFIILYLTGGSLNMVSTFAFLIVLGMVVDDAIIIGENIHTEQETTPGLEGAIKGATAMAKPVTFAVLTTAVSFSPLLFLPGPDGKMLASIPIIVLATLFFSLLEVLLILPAHLATETKTTLFKTSRLQHQFQRSMNWLLQEVYSPLLAVSLRWRYASVVVFIIMFFVSLSLIAGNWINVTLLADIEGDNSVATVSFPAGSNPEDLNAAALKIESAAFDIMNELAEKYDNPPIRRTLSRIAWHNNSEAIISLPLAAGQDRQISTDEIMAIWSERVGPVEGASKLQYNSSMNNTKDDSAINIALEGRDTEELERAAEALKNVLRAQSALFNVFDSQSETKEEIKLVLKDNAYDLGLDREKLSLQVRQAFQGDEVQSLQRSHGEVKVFLQFPKSERSSLWHLENMRIRVAEGFHVPLYAVADVFFKKGPAQIIRKDGKRTINVNASIDNSIAPIGKVWTSIQKEFLSTLRTDFPNVKWRTTGQQKSEQDMGERLSTGFLIAILVIYVLIAILFQSYVQPFIVLSAVPFALVGAIIGHIIFGLELTMWSAAGMIAVSGVVVNDNLVLIFYINEKRKQGINLFDAVTTAGVHRFRPILLTSLTTTAGLTPMLMEKSTEAVFLVPMAVSIAFGVMFATLISLFLIPSLYLILDDLGNLGRIFKPAPRSPSWDAEAIIDLDDDAKLIDDSYGDDDGFPNGKR